MKHRTRLPYLVLAAVAAAGLLAWLGFREGGWWAAEASSGIKGALVRRGPLRVTVVQRGNLEPKNSVSVKSEIEGRTTILFLVPEGSFVNEGDLVAELDSSALNERRVAQEIMVQNKQAAETKARQVLEIQRSQNESDIAAAAQNLEFAQADLRKYQEGDWPQQLQEAEEQIVLAEETMSQSKDRLDWSSRLEEQGFLTRTELESDQLAFERAKITLEQATRNKRLLIEYDNPRQLATLTAAVTEAQRELDRVKLQASARTVDYESDLSSAVATFRLEQEKLDKLNDQIEKARIYAPQDGMVVHTREEDGPGFGSQPITVGAEVREREEICTIPRSASMVVQAKVHETVLKQVQNGGQPCTIKVDAIPGREFHGVVESVAPMADKGSWWANPDQRLYATTISITDGVPEMRPGMSCSVEILVAELPDALYVPLQAVYYQRGETICFVASDSGVEHRKVTIGLSSEQWAEVKDGLREGETVLLSAPQGFKPEPAPEEQLEQPPMDDATGAPRGRPREEEGAESAETPSDAEPGRERSAEDGRRERPPGAGSWQPAGHGGTASEAGGKDQQGGAPAGDPQAGAGEPKAGSPAPQGTRQ
ncbi:MAG: efflux RND transporter periplasmic adaptor subunit [Planctomycetota bacterium]|nr:MAG: efflux RND transporter periplasmic adaptor subunit [Planctomycetota bacterium]